MVGNKYESGIKMDKEEEFAKFLSARLFGVPLIIILAIPALIGMFCVTIIHAIIEAAELQ